MSKVLYRFTLDCGRQGSLHGLFTAKPADVDGVIGKTADFGEVLGKHSYVRCILHQNMFEKLTDDSDFVQKFDQFKCASGHNPLHCLEE